MTKEEIEIGLAMGRTLIQEEWADKNEIEFVDELIAEGKELKGLPHELEMLEYLKSKRKI